jgi:hypothetical protein
VLVIFHKFDIRPERQDGVRCAMKMSFTRRASTIPDAGPETGRDVDRIKADREIFAVQPGVPAKSNLARLWNPGSTLELTFPQAFRPSLK